MAGALLNTFSHLRSLDNLLGKTLNFLRYSFFLIVPIFLLSCNDKPNTDLIKKVQIKLENGRYRVFRNGKAFNIKGASGFTNLIALREAGGNTIRTWDTTNLVSVLDEAEANGLAVVVGLPMPENNDMNQFYNKAELVSKQYQDYSTLVTKYKDHPSILFWCVGNELPFPHKPNYKNFYSAFNAIVDMVHSVDPDHPVTTTVLNLQEKNILNINLRTDIDFISFNIFGAISTMQADLEKLKWIWDGPFLITEWGIDGPWDVYQQTAWTAYIENTSTKKAELLLDRYQRFMPLTNPRFLGAMVFYWGEKQETTKTWFSLFDEEGAASASVDVMHYIWKSKWPQHQAPHLKYMLLDGKGARDNIIFSPDKMVSANLLLDQQDTTGLKYFWEILPEDWFKINGANSTKKVMPIKNLIKQQGQLNTVFRTPTKEGPYRLFVYVKDRFGRFSSCNTPFYVVEQ